MCCCVRNLLLLVRVCGLLFIFFIDLGLKLVWYLFYVCGLLYSNMKLRQYTWRIKGYKVRRYIAPVFLNLGTRC